MGGGSILVQKLVGQTHSLGVVNENVGGWTIFQEFCDDSVAAGWPQGSSPSLLCRKARLCGVRRPPIAPPPRLQTIAQLPFRQTASLKSSLYGCQAAWLSPGTFGELRVLKLEAQADDSSGLQQARTARSLTAIHLRSLTLAETQSGNQEREPFLETRSRRTRRGSASSSSSAPPEARSTASTTSSSSPARRSKSRSSTTSSLNAPHDVSTATSPTSLVSAVEAPALSTRARTTSSASNSSFHYSSKQSGDPDVLRKLDDEATQRAQKAAIRKRVNNSLRKCRAVLLATDQQAQDRVLWASEAQTRAASDVDWVIHIDQEADPALLGQHTVKVHVWVLQEGAESCSSKGKQKSACQDTVDKHNSWALALSYCIDLTRLHHLGSDVRNSSATLVV